MSQRRGGGSLFHPDIYDCPGDEHQASSHVERGYYEGPRKTSLRELAEQTAVARSTYEEHLRKAENKLLTNAGQFLRVVTATSTADSLGVAKPQQTEHATD
jgi:hypothetical protein